MVLFAFWLHLAAVKSYFSDLDFVLKCIYMFVSLLIYAIAINRWEKIKETLTVQYSAVQQLHKLQHQFISHWNLLGLPAKPNRFDASKFPLTELEVI